MTDEPRDDEIIGRALARAIETQYIRETPYDESRIGAPRGRSFAWIWQLAGAAVVLIVGAGMASWLLRPSPAQPVAASPTPAQATVAATTAPPASQAAATGTPAPTATATTRVFFVRDLLPPVSANAPGNGGNVATDRIVDRVTAAHGASAGVVPPGASNPLALIDLASVPSNVSATINGDTATVDFTLASGWGVHGASQVQALVQQLVYVITEEPGIRKARIVEHGKTSAVIDGLTVDRPLTREDVTDYAAVGTTTTAHGFGDASATAVRKLSTRLSIDTVAPALARFVVETDLQTTSPAAMYPDFTVDVTENNEFANPPLPGKWLMRVVVNGQDAAGANDTYTTVDRSPIRGILTTRRGNTTVYSIGLDDLRPWRVALDRNPVRIIVDIGGDPRTISGSNAVYAPAYGATVGRSFDVSGIEHNFEAGVNIRIRDDRQREVFKTSTIGTNCCEPGGTFATTVNVPTNVTGTIFLEVYEASPRDGSDLNVIRIPLVVR